MFVLMGVKVQVSGLQQVEPGQTYLFMSNHVSLFDIPLLGGYIPGIVRGIEADRQHKWPIYGLVMRRLGNVPIERGNIQSSVSTAKKTINLLKNGRSMIILPEGGRTTDGQLKPFKKLPFFMAKQAEKEIIPIGISGLFELKSKKSWIIKPTTIKITFGNVITVEQSKTLSTLELREFVRNEIKQLIDKP